VIHAFPFLIVFMAGLGAAVYTMLLGVTPSPAARTTTKIGMLTAPSVAAFAVIFGAVGYLCTTRTSLTPILIFVIALVAGVVTIPFSAPLLARLARSRKSSAGEDFDIEGQLATVVTPLSDGSPGDVTYNRDGRQVTQRALNLVPGALAAGHEVVIDRIENGIAYVEAWESVEKRL
jgi:membrane protein implicated in regulation of membrane protease activity